MAYHPARSVCAGYEAGERFGDVGGYDGLMDWPPSASGLKTGVAAWITWTETVGRRAFEPAVAGRLAVAREEGGEGPLPTALTRRQLWAKPARC